MSNERKRKHENLANAQAAANTSSLFGKHTNGSLTASLFGDSYSTSTPQNDLFSSSAKFQDAVKDRINKNAECTKSQKTGGATNNSANDSPSESRESILSRRKKQSSVPFLNEVTSLAPFPVDQDSNPDDNEQRMHSRDDNADETNRVPPDVCIQEISDIVRMHGFAVVKNVVSKQLLDTLSTRAEEIEAQVCQRLDNLNISWKCDITTDTKTFRFYEVASRCKGRMDVRYGTDQEPFSDSEILENISLRPIIDSLLGGVSGSDESHAPVLLYAGLIFSFAGSENQPWHQDGMPLFPELNAPELPPYAINVFLPLTDKDASMEAGPTEFIPGSHTMEEEVVLIKVEQANSGSLSQSEQSHDTDDPGIVSPLLNQGDALLYDYRVCHRGTSNLLLNGNTRRILYLMYARPWFKEHLNFGSERLFEERVEFE